MRCCEWLPPQSLQKWDFMSEGIQLTVISVEQELPLWIPPSISLPLTPKGQKPSSWKHLWKKGFNSLHVPRCSKDEKNIVSCQVWIRHFWLQNRHGDLKAKETRLVFSGLRSYSCLSFPLRQKNFIQGTYFKEQRLLTELKRAPCRYTPECSWTSTPQSFPC